uniref:Uncharacterized protein n=1 Tax=viral metagenome TaxID=1070528 RepID=A0A6H1ZIG5_9ZZZZ
MEWDVRLRHINLETGKTIKEFDVVIGAQNSVELAAIIGGAYRNDVQLLSFTPKIPGLVKAAIVEAPTEPPTSPTPSEELPSDIEVPPVELHSEGGGLEGSPTDIEGKTYESIELGVKKEDPD